MPAHFGGPAPTMEPTLYDEDLPWLGFHFDTEQVMFKKIEEDDSGPPGPPSRMAPSELLIKMARFLKRFRNVKSCQLTAKHFTKLT